MSDVITPIVVDTDESDKIDGKDASAAVFLSDIRQNQGDQRHLSNHRSALTGGTPNQDEIVVLEDNNGVLDGDADFRKSLEIGGKPIPIRKTRSGASSSNASAKPSLLDNPKISTIRQHYYPEGGWGWVICVCGFVINMLTNGLLLSFGVLHREILKEFGEEYSDEAMWLGSMAFSMGLFVSPLIVAFCRRKSTRLTAVFGGLTSALGCLFTSFASQLHQVFFSYGFLMAVGLGLARETSSLMVGQYFKRKRETVEIIIQSGTGVGVGIFSYALHHVIGALGWRLGLHAVTGIAVVPFFVGIFYRSASLYHPQRRAILHLKNQRKKIKDKSGVSDKPPFFDFSTLKSGAIVVTMVSAGLCSLGLYAPFFHFARIAEADGISDDSVLVLFLYLGLSFSIGCYVFGFLVVRRNAECMVAKHYLCQAAMIGTGLSHLSLCGLQGYNGYVIFAWMNGAFCGGVHYAIKMLTFECIRARSFGRAWAYVEWAQSLPVLIGIPVTGYISKSHGDRTGFYFSAACCFAGAVSMTCMNVYRYSYGGSTSRSGHGSCSTCASQAPSELRAQESIDTGVCTCTNNSVHSNNSAIANNPGHPKCQKTISFASTVNIATDDDEGGGNAKKSEFVFPSDDVLLDFNKSLGDEHHWCDNEQCIALSKAFDGFLVHAAADFEVHNHQDLDEDAAAAKPAASTIAFECDCAKQPKDIINAVTKKRPITVIEEVTSAV